MSENREPEGDEDMTAPPAIRLPSPPQGGFTSEDLDRLPGLPPHTELIDGGLFFVSPQRRFHTLILFLLELRLRRTCPVGLAVHREMTIVLGPHQRPEPDIVVVHADAIDSLDQTWFPADAVMLAVEVVSPDSEARDRERKPQLYAQAGIKHFWLIEQAESGRPLVYVYLLDLVSRTYNLQGVFQDQVKLSVPFPIDIDLTEIDRL
jgi:Uma2 family endonuclease